MSKLRSSARLAAVAAAGALVLAACGGGDDDTGGGGGTGAGAPAFNISTTTIVNPNTKPGGTLKLGAGSDADSWDAARAYYGYVWDLQRLYARTLMGFAPDPKHAAEVVPDLATAPGEASADFKTFKYTLRDGVKFDDGSPITSKDVKYALKRIYATDVISGGPTSYFLCLLDTCPDGTTPTYKGPYKDTSGEPKVDGQPSMETPDDKTIIFHLAQPYASFDYLMAIGPSSPVPQAKDDGENYTQHPVSSGPFKITQYDADTGITFERNTNWDQATDQIRKPLLDKITIDYITNLDDLDARLKAGTLDARVDADLQPTFQNEALADPNLKKYVDNPVDGSMRYLAISPDVKPLDNVHCRMAVFYAINKEAWRLAYGGAVTGEIAPNLTPAGLPGHDEKANPYPNGADFTGDITKAKDELNQCGQPNGFSTNMAYVNQGTGGPRSTAVQEALARVGIKVTLKAGEADTYYSQYIGVPSSVKNNKLGIMDAGWGADFPTTVGFWYSIAHGKARYPNGTSNYVNLNDPKVNGLLDQSNSAPKDQWNTIGRQVDDALMADAVYVPVMWTKSVYWRNARLTNVYSTNFFGLYDWVNIGTTDGA
jgi:peptide/nickel transport system substrate-binding protein